MYCNACGHRNPDSATFCSACGAALSRPPESPPSSPPDPVAAASPASAAGDRIAGPGLDRLDTDAWRAVVGEKNTDYYLRQFAHPPGAQRIRRWHWPAFFVTFFWLLYRKMYGWAVFYLFFPLIVGLLYGVIGLALNLAQGGINAFDVVWYVVLLGAPPAFANEIYYRHCRKLMIRPTDREISVERYLAFLDRKGGTAGGLATVAAVFFPGVMVLGMVAAIARPAYQDYTKRAQMSQAILSAMAVARQVGDRYERTGDIAPGVDDLPGRTEPSPFVRSITIDPATGVLDVTSSVTGNGGEMIAFQLVPTVGAGGKVTWACSGDPRFQKYMPLACRASRV